MLLGTKARKCVTLITIFFFLSILWNLFNAGLQGQQPQERSPDLPFPSHLLQFVQGNTKVFPGNIKDASIFSFHPGASSPGHAQNTLPKRSPEGILVICPHHLYTWLYT